MDIDIRPLSTIPGADLEVLLDHAFGPDRRTRTAYRIREAMTAIEALSFAAVEAGGKLIGSLQSWPVGLDDASIVLIGPVAVDPEYQRMGVGLLLMTRLIKRAPTTPMILIGDPEYYGRFFGFSAAATAGWSVPGPVDRHRLLARNVDGFAAHGALGPRAFARPAISA